MKWILFFLSLISLKCWGSCSSVKAPSEVNVFLDLNASWREVKIAEEKACREGKSLRVIPDWDERVEFSKVAEDFAKADQRLESCLDEKCREKEEAKKEKYSQKMATFKRPRLDKELLSKEIAQLATDHPNIDIGRLVISGHDGGGNFDGFNGQVSRLEIYEAFKDFPKKRESIHALYLLGCNSGTTQELSLWNNIFPKSVFISGYEGQAPFNYRKKGLDYFRSSLDQEEEIFNAQTKEQLIEQLHAIDHIKESYSGIKINCFGILNDKGLPLEINAFGIPVDQGSFIREDPAAGCHDPIFEEKFTTFQQYYNGILPIPFDSGPSSPVRGLYNFASSKAHCMQYQEEFAIPKKAAFGLNFFHDFKRNALLASESYKESIADETFLNKDKIYQDYIQFIDKQMSEKDDYAKASRYFNDITPHLNQMSLEELWVIIDKVEADLEGKSAQESSYKQILVDGLKVMVWNSKEESVSKESILKIFNQEVQQKPSREEFNKKYGELIDRFNSKGRELLNYIPDEKTSMLSRDVMLKDATRAQIMADFHERKIRSMDTYWDNHHRLASSLQQYDDPFMAVLFTKSTEANAKIMQGLDHYQKGVVDFTCVPFNWHERQERGSDKIGNGDPCVLPSI